MERVSLKYGGLFCVARQAAIFVGLYAAGWVGNVMLDGFSRKIDYLRLSVTDLCSYRCIYCMPEQGVTRLRHEDILSVEEIEGIVREAAMLGVRKVRITGGEPLVRRGILEIVRRVARVPGVTELCLTTNGAGLVELAAPLMDAGVTRLNLSLDTLRPERFARITRVGCLEDTLRGMRAAQAAGFTDTKINVVLLGGINIDEIPDFVRLTQEHAVQVRFIELMPLGVCAAWPPGAFVSADAVLEAVPGLVPVGRQGVASVYRAPGAVGTVGLIRPLTDHFCPACNRIRVTADGRLKACLHTEQEVLIKGLSGDALREAIVGAVMTKPARHHISPSVPSETSRDMNQIGG